MNQELKNFNDLLESLTSSLSSGEYGTCKTIVNIYEEMLPNIIRLYYSGGFNYNVNNSLNKHLFLLKKLDNHITSEVVSKLISDENFKSLHVVQYTQNKIKSFIHKITEARNQFENKNDQSSNTTKQLLELSVETGTLITQTNESIRGTGKTAELIKKANELDCTLVVGMNSVKQHIDNFSNSLGYKIDCQYISDLAKIQGRRMKNGKFLVDDSVSNQIIKELVNNRNEFVGGFNSIHNSLHQRDKALDFLNAKLNKLINERDVLINTYLGSAVLVPDYQLLINKINLLKEILSEINK